MRPARALAAARLATRLLVGATLVGGGACSTVLVKGPPSPLPPPGQALECTDSRVFPWVDTFIAAELVGSGAFEIARRCDQPDCSSPALVTALFVGGAVAAVSVVWGHIKVNRCRAANALMPPMPRMTVQPVPPPVEDTSAGSLVRGVIEERDETCGGAAITPGHDAALRRPAAVRTFQLFAAREPSGQPVGSIITDRDGHFAVPLPPGEYCLAEPAAAGCAGVFRWSSSPGSGPLTIEVRGAKCAGEEGPQRPRAPAP